MDTTDCGGLDRQAFKDKGGSTVDKKTGDCMQYAD
jgi:hypothetical protein